MPVARIAVSGMPARISQITEICEIVLENSDDWHLSEDADWEREAQQICNRFSQPSQIVHWRWSNFGGIEFYICSSTALRRQHSWRICYLMPQKEHPRAGRGSLLRLT